jgi:hypothetical protein
VQTVESVAVVKASLQQLYNHLVLEYISTSERVVHETLEIRSGCGSILFFFLCVFEISKVE